MITGHIKVWIIVKKSYKKSLNGYSAWITQKDVSPFTYFGRLIIPSDILNSPHIQSVVSHERIHAKGQHCIDLCIAEFLFLFQWFNPFALFMKNAVRDNLEYLTDHEVIGHVNQQEYQLSMISLASKTAFNTFPSISNQTQLKKRIIMMKNNKTNRFQWIRMLAIIPLLTILTATLSGREFQLINEADPILDSNLKMEKIATDDKEDVLSHDSIQSMSACSYIPIGDNPLYVINEKKYTADEFKKMSIKTNDITHLEILSWYTAEKYYGKEAINGAIIIKTKNNSENIQ